jgi:exosortase
MTPQDRKTAIAFALLASAFVLLYHHVLAKLAHDWATDDNYSHGFLVVPIAMYLIWERRAALKDTAMRPSNLGLLLAAASLGVLSAGVLGSELFLTRLSIVGVLAGFVLFVAGPRHLKIVLFPLGMLLLAIPIPALIFNQIAFPLQLLASQFGAAVLATANVPVLREGNLMVLANTTLEVAEACSGMRSLMSLLTLGILIGYFTDRRTWVRVSIALVTIPIAIFANGVRVAGTGIAAHYLGPQAAEGFLHLFSGWLVFVVALTLVFAARQLITALAPAVAPGGRPVSPVPA